MRFRQSCAHQFPKIAGAHPKRGIHDQSLGEPIWLSELSAGQVPLEIASALDRLFMVFHLQTPPALEPYN